jgi:catechol 2,3-dioxygenase-like lactoylglutathione lyase family enzyme
MFSHIMVGTNDIDKARDFYNAVLGVVGAPEPVVNENATGQTRLFYIHNDSIFCVSEPIEQPPGPRDTTMGALYLCYFRDLDGHKICGLHRPG